MPTTNNNWPTPVATDLVKDGWEAIKDLGDAIDTTLGVYAPSTPGLTLINTTSFSAVASQALPANTFTSTYENYKIIVNMTSGSLTMRLRKAGTNATTNYTFQYAINDNTVEYNARLTGQAQWELFDGGYTYQILELNKPQVTGSTAGYLVGGKILATPLLGAYFYGHTTSESYDSMDFIASSGTITGTITVFGYQK
jgi:hypothetical protein